MALRLIRTQQIGVRFLVPALTKQTVLEMKDRFTYDRARCVFEGQSQDPGDRIMRRGAGNTEGGWEKFFVGSGLLSLGVYMLLDSVRVISGGAGIVSGTIMGVWGNHEAYAMTSSMGVIFIPLFGGLLALAYDVTQKWARWLAGIGLVLIIVEMLSRIRFFMNLKTSHLVLMIGCCAVGLGLVFASYRPHRQRGQEDN